MAPITAIRSLTAVSLLGLAVAACGAPQATMADRPPGAAPGEARQAAPVEQGGVVPGQPPVYVLNLHGAEKSGRPDQRPARLVLSEFSSMSGVTWHTWGPTRATGAGKLSGTWCLPQCMDTPYDAEVTLSNVMPVKGKGYFTRYRIESDLPQAQRPDADLSGVLPTP
ncbi:hypothetical protein [Microbispora sp. NPDC049125]|uniref:hypothetical protein n=1 Tax=Microbispora sp. NPDC049125 TaxID=3154929 RepID=UPI0034669825